MLIPAGTDVFLVAFFEDADGLGVTGLSPTVDAWEVQSDGTKTERLTGSAMTEVGDGLYYKKHTLVATACIFAVAKDGSATAARQNVPCTALPGDMMTTLDTRSTFDPATDTVANVTTVGTVDALGTQAKADVNAEADAALADYDPPTKGELDAATSGLSTFDPASDAVVVGENRDKDGYTLSDSEFIRKYILNKLVPTANEDGTKTYKLYDDDGVTVLATWVFDTKTGERSKAT